VKDAPLREALPVTDDEASFLKLRGWGEYFQALGVMWRNFDNGFFYRAVRLTAADSPYTMQKNDSAIVANAVSGPITINLLPAADCRGKRISVKKIDASANAVTIDGDGGETIDGVTTKSTTTQYVTLSLFPDPSTSVWWLD
jgi:hypothetical protein